MDLSSQASAGRRVMARWLPAALVGVVQPAIVILVVALIGVSIASPLGLVGVGILGAAAFAATNQALVSPFGGVGRMSASRSSRSRRPPSAAWSPSRQPRRRGAADA